MHFLIKVNIKLVSGTEIPKVSLLLTGFHIGRIDGYSTSYTNILFLFQQENELSRVSSFIREIIIWMQIPSYAVF